MDEKLTFFPHVEQFKHKFLKILSILKALLHQGPGAAKQLVIRVFISLVGSRLDHGSAIYGSATKTALKMVDPLLHLSLRLACGAFCTSPVHSFDVESDKWCSEHRRTYIDLLYASKVSVMTHRHFRSVFLYKSSSQLFLSRPSVSVPFSHRVREKASELSTSSCRIL